MIGTLARGSICPCGAPAVKIGVVIGQTVEVIESLPILVRHKCPRCGHEQIMKCVIAIGAGHSGYMPVDLLDLEDPAEAARRIAGVEQ